MKAQIPSVFIDALQKHITEVLIHHDHIPLLGIATLNKTQYVFNAYSETEDNQPLFLFAAPSRKILQQMLTGEIPVLDMFAHPKTIIWKETANSGLYYQIDLTETTYEQLTPTELPHPQASLKG